jgi:hypothetical protein
MATSYSNPGGTGGTRPRMIALTLTGAASGNPYQLLNGSTSDTGFFFSGGGAASGYTLLFDFGLDQYVIDEIKWYQSAASTQGTWKVQGSNNLSTWTDVGSSFTLGGSTTQTITAINGNTTAYAAYRLQGVSGNTSSSPWLYEIEFKISPVQNRANGTAYTNTDGSGDRTALITVAAGGSMPWNGVALNHIINAAYSNTDPYINNATTTGNLISFDFGAAKLVDEIAFWYNGGSYGTWKWQGSNDNLAWTDVGSTFSLAPAGNSPCIQIRSLNGNTITYRYLRVLCTAGAAFNGDGNMQEVEFRIAVAPVIVAQPQPFVIT